VIDRSIDLALLAQERIRHSLRQELLAPVSLSTVCFRRRFEGFEDEERQERLNAALVSGLEASGIGLISSTRLRGRYALRLCVVNHTSTRPRRRAGARLDRAGPVVARRGGGGEGGDHRPLAAGPRRHPGMARQGALDASTLTRIPLLAGLTADQLEAVARDGWQRDTVAGEIVVRRWDGSREFFVVLGGTPRSGPVSSSWPASGRAISSASWPPLSGGRASATPGSRR
jgi:aromatic-L-amino-acid/L-tryptophan decarboxylase